MSPVVLRRGEDWLFPASGYVIEMFHQIALAHGSQARWLPASGTLVTGAPEEIGREHPYETWRDEALQVVLDC